MLSIRIMTDKRVVPLNKHFQNPFNLTVHISRIPKVQQPTRVTINVQPLFSLICHLHKLKIFLGSMEIDNLGKNIHRKANLAGTVEMQIKSKLKFLKGKFSSEYSVIEVRDDYLQFLTLRRTLVELVQMSGMSFDLGNLTHMAQLDTESLQHNIKIFALATQARIKNE